MATEQAPQRELASQQAEIAELLRKRLGLEGQASRAPTTTAPAPVEEEHYYEPPIPTVPEPPRQDELFLRPVPEGEGFKAAVVRWLDGSERYNQERIEEAQKVHVEWEDQRIGESTFWRREKVKAIEQTQHGRQDLIKGIEIMLPELQAVSQQAGLANLAVVEVEQPCGGKKFKKLAEAGLALATYCAQNPRVYLDILAPLAEEGGLSTEQQVFAAFLIGGEAVRRKPVVDLKEALAADLAQGALAEIKPQLVDQLTRARLGCQSQLEDELPLGIDRERIIQVSTLISMLEAGSPKQRRLAYMAILSNPDLADSLGFDKELQGRQREEIMENITKAGLDNAEERIKVIRKLAVAAELKPEELPGFTELPKEVQTVVEQELGPELKLRSIAAQIARAEARSKAYVRDITASFADFVELEEALAQEKVGRKSRNYGTALLRGFLNAACQEEDAPSREISHAVVQALVQRNASALAQVPVFQTEVRAEVNTSGSGKELAPMMRKKTLKEMFDLRAARKDGSLTKKPVYKEFRPKMRAFLQTHDREYLAFLADRSPGALAETLAAVPGVGAGVAEVNPVIDSLSAAKPIVIAAFQQEFADKFAAGEGVEKDRLNPGAAGNLGLASLMDSVWTPQDRLLYDLASTLPAVALNQAKVWQADKGDLDKRRVQEPNEWITDVALMAADAEISCRGGLASGKEKAVIAAAALSKAIFDLMKVSNIPQPGQPGQPISQDFFAQSQGVVAAELLTGLCSCLPPERVLDVIRKMTNEIASEAGKEVKTGLLPLAPDLIAVYSAAEKSLQGCPVLQQEFSQILGGVLDRAAADLKPRILEHAAEWQKKPEDHPLGQLVLLIDALPKREEGRLGLPQAVYSFSIRGEGRDSMSKILAEKLRLGRSKALDKQKPFLSPEAAALGIDPGGTLYVQDAALFIAQAFLQSAFGHLESAVIDEKLLASEAWSETAGGAAVQRMGYTGLTADELQGEDEKIGAVSATLRAREKVQDLGRGIHYSQAASLGINHLKAYLKRLGDQVGVTLEVLVKPKEGATGIENIGLVVTSGDEDLTEQMNQAAQALSMSSVQLVELFKQDRLSLAAQSLLRKAVESKLRAK